MYCNSEVQMNRFSVKKKGRITADLQVLPLIGIFMCNKLAARQHNLVLCNTTQTYVILCICLSDAPCSHYLTNLCFNLKMPTKPVLYYALFSPPARACILTAKLIGLDVELKWVRDKPYVLYLPLDPSIVHRSVDFSKKEHLSDEFLKVRIQYIVLMLILLICCVHIKFHKIDHRKNILWKEIVSVKSLKGSTGYFLSIFLITILYSIYEKRVTYLSLFIWNVKQTILPICLFSIFIFYSAQFSFVN